MKPTKNRIFCKDSNRNKMLFEDEKKANNFMKFNGEEILEESGYKPERSYYCISCGGWHLTSSKTSKNIKSKSENIVEIYKNELEKKEAIKIKLLEKKSVQQEILRNTITNLDKKLDLILSNTNTDFILNDLISEFENLKNIKGGYYKGSNKSIKNLHLKILSLKNMLYES